MGSGGSSCRAKKCVGACSDRRRRTPPAAPAARRACAARAPGERVGVPARPPAGGEGPRSASAAAERRHLGGRWRLPPAVSRWKTDGGERRPSAVRPQRGPQRVFLLGLAPHDVAPLEPGERRQPRQRNDPAARQAGSARRVDDTPAPGSRVAHDSAPVAERGRRSGRSAARHRALTLRVAVLLQPEQLQPRPVAQLHVVADQRVEATAVHHVVRGDDERRFGGRHGVRQSLTPAARRD